MKAEARCPNCPAATMRNRTNGYGGCYLECLDCGYYEPVTRKPDPKPTEYKIDHTGKKRVVVRVVEVATHKYGPKPRRIAS